MNKRTERAVLNFCNAIRKKLGKRPVTRIKKGRIREYDNCPVANTVGGITVCPYSGGDISINNREQIINDKIVFEFINDFDAGKYPELVAE